MRILLAIDGSEFSDAAAHAVIARYPVRKLKCEFSAAEPSKILRPPKWLKYRPEESAQAAKALVETTANALRSAGIRVTTDIVEGDPKPKSSRMPKRGEPT